MYIEDGKHRFYAHVLLNKDCIPASIREYNTDGKNHSSVDMISIRRPFHDGIVNPNKALEFIEYYKCLFENVSFVEMENDEGKKNSILRIRLLNGDNIEFKNCCTSGNRQKSSIITFEILTRLGYQVDMKYIEKNTYFRLEDKRDAHNLDFSKEANISIIHNQILRNMEYKEMDIDGSISKDIFKLHKYISKHKAFNTTVFDFSFDYSGMIEINNTFYYLVNVRRADNSDLIHFFRDRTHPFISTEVEYLGVIENETKILY